MSECQFCECQRDAEKGCNDCFNTGEKSGNTIAQLRADLAAVEKERDGMRNCQNCGISELTGGTCEHWQHGMCTDREESDNYLEHWQPLKEQP